MTSILISVIAAMVGTGYQIAIPTTSGIIVLQRADGSNYATEAEAQAFVDSILEPIPTPMCANSP